MSRIQQALFTLLVLWCSSGFALKCYKCQNKQNCAVNETQMCSDGENACLTVTPTGALPTRKCYPYGQCNLDSLKPTYGSNLHFMCCQTDLCNSSVTFEKNKVVLGVVALFTFFINLVNV
ncbi:CD59 glycoprotein [Protopterus annectens]|uniref:CD59 glycoprotein n=1 Tax=Protopterus annectens TaxID=7888 RepID=UPI001CF9A8AA|nr:CD59 glycoprotein [Protopterus annectens]